MGAKRIDDHSFWAGGPSKDSVLAEGAKVRSITSAEGAGELDRYEDTEQAIERVQDFTARKVEKERMRDGYRN